MCEANTLQCTIYNGILNLFHDLYLGFRVCLGFASYMWAVRDLDANQLVWLSGDKV